MDSLNLFQSSQADSNCDVKERFWDKAENTQKKLEAMRAEKESAEMAACTFSPMTNQLTSSRRTISEFADDVKGFLKAKEAKLEALRSDHRTSEASEFRAFTPELCSKSRLMVERQRQRPSSEYAQLHQRKRSLLELRLERLQETEVFDYTPKINKRSSSLHRAQSIGDILHGDAVRRLNAIPEVEDKPLKYMASKSSSILYRKLVSDFEATSADYEGDRLNYTQLKDLMERLQLTSAPDASEGLTDVWRELKGDATGRVSKGALLQFIGAVLGLVVSQPCIGTAQKVSKEQMKQWHAKFIGLYQHRTIQVPAEMRLADRFVSPSFTPALDSKSRKLHTKVYRSRKEQSQSQSIGDFLHTEKQRLKQQLDQIQRDKEQAEAAECSFKPALVARPKTAMSGKCGSEALYKYSKEQRLTRLEKQKAAETERRLKELGNCTFRPASFVSPRGSFGRQKDSAYHFQVSEKASKDPSIGKKGNLQGRQRDSKATTPSRQASISDKSKSTASKRDSFQVTSPTSSFSKKASRGSVRSQNSSRTSARSSISKAPQSTQLSSMLSHAEEEEVVLSLKVNISPTLSAYLTIMEGEDTEAAVEAFVKTHKLGSVEASKLKQHVEVHLTSARS
jgi:hypothetical protein